MRGSNTEQLLIQVSKDLDAIGKTTSGASSNAESAAELSQLREKLAQSEKLSNQTFEFLKKQSEAIRAMRADLQEKNAKVQQLEISIGEQNKTIARLLNLPPNVSEVT